MIVSIHQPEYLPWLGLLDKARRADVFVLLDDVQFNRASLQHRAKIASPKADGFSWLTIPFIHKHPQLIRDVQVADPSWPARHLALIEAAYAEAPAASVVLPAIRRHYASPLVPYGGQEMVRAAVRSMLLLFEVFGVKTEIVSSSQLATDGQKGDRVLSICKQLGATRYLSGRSGATYLDAEMFQAAGIEIEVQSYEPPEGLSRVPGMSALDAWMRLGERAPEVLT